MNKFSRFVQKVIEDVLPPVFGVLVTLTLLSVLLALFIGAIKAILLIWLMEVQI